MCCAAPLQSCLCLEVVRSKCSKETGSVLGRSKTDVIPDQWACIWNCPCDVATYNPSVVPIQASPSKTSPGPLASTLPTLQITGFSQVFSIHPVAQVKGSSFLPSLPHYQLPTHDHVLSVLLSMFLKFYLNFLFCIGI